MTVREATYADERRWERGGLSITYRPGATILNERYIGPENAPRPRDKPAGWVNWDHWTYKMPSFGPRRTSPWFAGPKRCWEFRALNCWVFVRFVDIFRLHYYDRRHDLHITYRRGVASR